MQRIGARLVRSLQPGDQPDRGDAGLRAVPSHRPPKLDRVGLARGWPHGRGIENGQAVHRKRGHRLCRAERSRRHVLRAAYRGQRATACCTNLVRTRAPLQIRSSAASQRGTIPASRPRGPRRRRLCVQTFAGQARHHRPGHCRTTHRRWHHTCPQPVPRGGRGQGRSGLGLAKLAPTLVTRPWPARLEPGPASGGHGDAAFGESSPAAWRSDARFPLASAAEAAQETPPSRTGIASLDQSTCTTQSRGRGVSQILPRCANTPVHRRVSAPPTSSRADQSAGRGAARPDRTSQPEPAVSFQGGRQSFTDRRFCPSSLRHRARLSRSRRAGSEGASPQHTVQVASGPGTAHCLGQETVQENLAHLWGITIQPLLSPGTYWDARAQDAACKSVKS